MMQIFNSNVPGPTIVIMAGVHGNESCGLQAFADILPGLSILKGQVTFVIGNPKAVAIHQREFQGNLNRMFRPDEDMAMSERETYEYRRSRELMPLLAKTDALLDIHSSSTKDSTPFIICEPQSYACASVLPAEIVVSGIDALHKTGTDAYVNQSGGLGICIECGYHTDPEASQIAVSAIQNFLKYFGLIDGDVAVPKQQKHIKAGWVYKNKKSFVLSKNYQEFESIKKGEIIGIDDTEVVYAPYDGNIIFPHNTNIPNSEAFLFGR